MNARRERNKQQQNQPDRQLEQPNGKVLEKDENLIELGKYFYTLSHLVFGGVVLVILLDFSDRHFLSLVYGLLATAFFALTGWLFVKKGNLKR